MRSFMRQTKYGLKGIINSFGIARDTFRQANELLSALDSKSIASSYKMSLQSINKSLVVDSLGRTPRNSRKVIIRAPSRSSSRPQQIRKCC